MAPINAAAMNMRIELIGVFMIQMRPSRDLAYRQQFKNLVYQALIN